MWTQNKLYQPQNPKLKRDRRLPHVEPKPYALLDDEMSAQDMADILSQLVFTKARDWQRTIHLTPKARDKLVNALLPSPTS